jgi:hypothetical protein
MKKNFKIQILTQVMLQPTNLLKLFMHYDHSISKKMAFELMGLPTIGKYCKSLSSFWSTILYIGIIYVPSKKYKKCSFPIIDIDWKV